ncbi:hypothetical protein ACFWZT_12870 [Streptomyces alboflavus]|uniref:hypothetical protein n=1 Tax=Streptomyces alboflavus TaxID=67267 RepID=UPI00368F770C
MRTGPRHAAPKKPLLTRLHVPAGKAIALAAMPTAVLMGMGLTPQLAQAKPGVPKNPFRDGPCVTAPDEQSKDAEKDAKDEQDAKEKAAKEAADKAEAAREKADEAKDKAEGKDGDKSADGSGTSKPSGGDADEDASGSGSSGDADSDNGSGDSDTGSGDSDKGDAADEPAPDKPKNPLDPLGLGDAIKDILTPKEKKAQEEKAQEERAAKEESGDEKSSGSSDDDAKDSDDGDRATKPVEDTLGKAKDGLKDTSDKADKAEDRLKDAAEKADEVAEKAEKAAEKAEDVADKAEDKADPEESKDPMAPDEDGKKPFPCVVEKKVDGDDEQSPAPIPNQPWHLEASSLLLKGADYKGVVNLKMPDGRTKQALKYIISGGTDIGDLHQIVESPNGKKYHVQAAKGSTSTIRNGDTTMYTERISGNLFGLIPITFDPEHPPPLNLPLIYFTNVKVQQAGQFGGELTIPGLHQSITD